MVDKAVKAGVEAGLRPQEAMEMTPRDLHFYHRGWYRRLVHERQSIALVALPFLQPPKGKGERVTVSRVAGDIPDWTDD